MDHCRALGCRIGVTVNMGEVDVAQLKQSWPWYYAKAQGDWFAPHQPAGGWGDSRAASYPVDDVHQARITEGVGR